MIRLSDIIEMVQEHLLTLQITKQKLAIYLLLGLLLTLIYSIYLKSVITTLLTVPNGDTILHYIWNFPTIYKFFFFTGWPFVALVFLDETWSSKDAARVVLAAFIVSIAFWFHHYGVGCPASALLFFFPFILSATLCHGLGLFMKWSSNRHK